MRRCSSTLLRIISYRFLAIIFLACMMINLPSGVCSSDRVPFTVEKGRLDLSGWIPEQMEPVKLNGPWEFYWERILEPGEFTDPADPAEKEYFPIPGLWKGNLANRRALTPKGYATYRMVVTGLRQNELYGLYISDILSAGSIWVNGRRLMAGGQVGKNKTEEIPRAHSLTAGFTLLSDELEIVIQVSNFHNSQGGINADIRFGTDRQIREMILHKWLITGSLGCTLMILGLYHLAFFGIRRKEPINLYFGFYCVFWSLQTLFGVNGECLMAAVFPSLPWRLSIDLTLLSYGFTTPLMVMFYHELFPNRQAKKINFVYQVPGAVFIVYLLFALPNAFDPRILIYALVSLSAFIYLFAMFIRDTLKKRKGIYLLIPGYLVLTLTMINDLLHDLHVIETTALIRYGIFFFILSYAFLISARFSMAFSAIEDLTGKLKEKNIELLKLDHLKDNFLAVVSHELRTPLNGIIGIAQSLTQQNNFRAVSLIISSATRLLSLINDILDFAGLKNRGLTLEMQPLNINPLLNSIVMIISRLADHKPLKIINRIPDSFPMVMADENRLSQILFNLLGNAVKYTDKGEIAVEAVLEGQWAKITVRDTGIGIPEDKLSIIFQSFEQADQGMSRKYPGTGLGLSIAKELVLLHGGDIGVTSGINQGSAFWFTLKTDFGSDVQLPEASEDSLKKITGIMADPVYFTPPPLVQKKTGEKAAVILVVDDDPVNLEVVTAHLNTGNFHVITCHNGPMALKHIEKGEIPDLVLLDVMMPGMSGYEVCQKIRETYSASILPVIMLTAGNRIQNLLKGFESGANDYLTKPFLKDELLARLQTQLQLKQSFETMKENLSLKKELAVLEKREITLRLTQRRLSGMLDSIEDAVLAVNPALEITFCNHPFEILTGYPVKEILGRPVTELFHDLSAGSSTGLLSALKNRDDHQREWYYSDLAIKGTGQRDKIRTDICLSFPDPEGDDLRFLILKKSGPDLSSSRSIEKSENIIKALDTDLQRLRQFEILLEKVSARSGNQSFKEKEDLKAIDNLLEELNTHLRPDDVQGMKRRLAVQVLNMTCDLWALSTKQSKLELAERSGIWNIYIEKDGWARTQTLDKYLKEETLPARPRWKSVLQTADFVLALCDAPLPLRKELEYASARLKGLI